MRTRVLTCVDCILAATPDGPSFHNLNPGDGEPLWVCEDCREKRLRIPVLHPPPSSVPPDWRQRVAIARREHKAGPFGDAK